jgi:hypothetical protein
MHFHLTEIHDDLLDCNLFSRHFSLPVLGAHLRRFPSIVHGLVSGGKVNGGRRRRMFRISFGHRGQLEHRKNDSVFAFGLLLRQSRPELHARIDLLFRCCFFRHERCSTGTGPMAQDLYPASAS